MTILVVSDIHANLTALESVLAHAGNVEAVWCLGDVVGYGPDPNECIARLGELPNLVCIMGNHDAAAVNYISNLGFNPEARKSLKLTQSALNDTSQSFLENLPERLSIGDVTLVHGSPRAPVMEYLLDNHAATENFDYFDTDYCMVGHSHLPVMYSHTDNQMLARLLVLEGDQKLQLEPRAIINPGSVGQPRDRDPRASYGLFDPKTHTWEVRRVPYDIAAVQERMLAAGLPSRHIERLSTGW